MGGTGHLNFCEMEKSFFSPGNGAYVLAAAKAYGMQHSGGRSSTSKTVGFRARDYSVRDVTGRINRCSGT
jgi:hypothetical protein